MQIWAQKFQAFCFPWKLEHIVSQGCWFRIQTFDPKIHFWTNLGPKSQSCTFCLKIDTDGIWRMLVLIPTLVSWISNFKWSKFGPKKARLFVLSKSWHTWYLEDADFYFNIYFLNFKLKLHFWLNLGQKGQICPFCLKIGMLAIVGMWILISRLLFWISKPKSI